MRHDVHIAGRQVLADAGELIERFGEYAASEAVRRAGESRDVGNLVHFCRWRQAARMIALLRDDEVTGALH
ncbi:MAG: hypothetical protein JOZ90_01935 [Alphaproteobacteria bacterium]|nr:hypothetical protein [Alphaproteobacteria bacterium]MBV9370764.1 hypothetical protein [Alphaproteobacteria bacterium]MBV9899837.1 hypothetical protein [Alphaproteobacteria bacterium]